MIADNKVAAESEQSAIPYFIVEGVILGKLVYN